MHIYVMLRCRCFPRLKLFTAVMPLEVKLRIIKSLEHNNYYKTSRTTKINLTLFHIHKMALRAL